jgi:orotidine-5'-phosphate decarboxylase
MTAQTPRIIPALDSTVLDEVLALARKVDQVDCVYGYKIGFALGLTYGLPKVVQELRRFSTKPIIYDHQKAATDIPDTGKLFAKTLADAGINEAILFPQAGPETLTAWTHALTAQKLKVIVGGIMTHPRYLASEGGFLSDGQILNVYKMAVGLGVKSFVVPLTKPDLVRTVVDRIGPGSDWEFYSPGLGAQGGDLSNFGFIRRHYVIVGRSLMSATDPVAYLQSIFKKEGKGT